MSRRRKQPAAFSLFAFQDIITSVTGIIVLVTLFLTIELMEQTENKPQTTTVELTQQTQQTNEEIRDQIKELNALLENYAKGVNSLPTTDPDALKKLVDDNQRQLDEIEKEVENRKQQLAESESNLEDAQTNQQQTSITGTADLKKLASDIKDLEAKLRKLQSRSRLLFKVGTPGQSIWIIEITDTGFRCAPVGIKAVPRTFSTPTSFLAWANKSPKSGSQLFLCIKPSGISNFKNVIAKIPSRLKLGFRPIGLGERVIDDDSGAGI